ncbi:MAG: nitrous oxide reductase family maturation protein NosD [Pseudomonadota bacterium]
MGRIAAFAAAVSVLALAAAGTGAAVSAPPTRDAAELQAMIDAAPDNAEIVPPPGVYRGRLVIEKPVILDGRDQVIIDAGGTGTVLVIRTDNATVRNLRLTNTGKDHNAEDSGIQIRGNNNIVKDNVIDDALFGIDLQQSYNNIIRRNRITSKNLDLGMRGDAIRLWYSDDNVLEDNEVRDSRDFVLWYSKRNRVTGTLSTGGRYGMHFMFSADNVIENNRFIGNSVGISMMYDHGDVVRNNVISHSTGATGTCISLKEASAVVIEGNELLYCANGIFLDVSPFQPDTINRIERNRIAFNDIAISFLNDWTGNVFKENRITGNITEVAVFGGGSAKRNTWEGNTWDGYEGWDRDGDGIGDTPYRVMGYASRVWMEIPTTRFFKGTALLEVVDFLDRLAPFSEPEVLLEDARPVLETKS